MRSINETKTYIQFTEEDEEMGWQSFEQLTTDKWTVDWIKGTTNAEVGRKNKKIRDSFGESKVIVWLSLNNFTYV